MPTDVSYGQQSYRYSAISPQGLRRKGTMRASSPEAVARALQDDGWSPLAITGGADRGMNMDLTAMLTGGEPIVAMTAGESANFFRQVGELLAAGVSLGSVLDSIAEEATPKIGSICETLKERISAGIPLSEALEAYPEAFDDVMRSYIASGESAGTLVESVRLLADNLDKRYRLKLKIKGVTAYPKFVSMAIAGIVIIMVWRMVPLYSSMYQDFGSDLPLPTRLLVSLSENMLPLSGGITFPTPFFLGEADWSILGVLGRIVAVVGTLIGTEYLRNRSGKKSSALKTVMKWATLLFLFLFTAELTLNTISAAVWSAIIGGSIATKSIMATETDDLKKARLIDNLRFKMPVMGNLVRLTSLYQWSSTLSGSLGAGVPMTRALELSGRAAGSVWHRAAAKRLRETVASGIPLSEGMLEMKDLFPGSMRSMTATGEEAGSLPVMLGNASKTIESEIDMIISGLAAKVEVVLLVFMGVVVGGILVALYLPILNLAGTIGG